MEKQIKILEKLGLSRRQALVYAVLLAHGEVTMTSLARLSQQKRPTLYLVISELDMQGLISEVIKGKKKYYSAVHPRRIGELLKFRLHEFDEILPELIAKYDSSDGKPKVVMLQGIEGVRTAYREAFQMMSEGKEGLWLGNIGVLIEQYPDIMREYKRTIGNLSRYKIRELIFGDHSSRDWVENMNKKKRLYHQIKFLTDFQGGNSDQFIVGNTIFQFSLGDQGNLTQVFTVITTSTQLAQTARETFNMLWKQTPH